MTLFNERIRQVRIDRDMTQKEFAEYLQVTPRAYQYYEAGTREPTLEKAYEIADLLQVSLDYLVGRSDER
jgi:transcriptional regulator with XRE-family HTH domain